MPCESSRRRAVFPVERNRSPRMYTANATYSDDTPTGANMHSLSVRSKSLSAPSPLEAIGRLVREKFSVDCVREVYFLQLFSAGFVPAYCLFCDNPCASFFGDGTARVVLQHANISHPLKLFVDILPLGVFISSAHPAQKCAQRARPPCAHNTRFACHE